MAKPKMIPFPTDKKYNIIYADPGWSYNDKCRSGSRGSEFKYKCMLLDDICSLPVKNITANDAWLFLWVTMPQLPNAFKVIESWGFKFKCCGFMWAKRCKKNQNKWHFGMGSYTRANGELCLLATKGKPKRVSAAVSMLIEAPVEKHSQKPSIVRDKIVELCGDLPRIELFARDKISGWDCYGDEI